MIKKALYLLFLSLFFISACTEKAEPLVAFKRGDYETAYKLWAPLAKDGDIDAQNYLGIIHYLGLGTSKDYSKALEWYGLAAKAGHPDAQRNYGDMIYHGRGINKDIADAYKWYFAAFQQGNDKAGRQLEVIAASGNLSPNQQMHAKIDANEFILDKKKHFMSHDTYIEKK